MKPKYQQESILLFVVLMAAMTLWPAQKAVAAGACTAARFHDWCPQCPPLYAGAGSATPPVSCSECAYGMPRWWVSEPFINLLMVDTPLSYKLSSGQEMSFQFFYRQRYELPEPDEIPNYYNVSGNYTGHNVADSYLQYARTMNMTNASWGHTWMKDIVFWDTQWEFTSPPRLLPFSYGFEALVFSPEGDLQYFYSTNNNTQTYLKDSQSQMQLRPSSALGWPTVNLPVADANGIYWGDTQTNGFQIVNPDGSLENYGLCFYPFGLQNNAIGAYSGAHAFLTQQIDPQGRITKLGYELETNTIAYSFRIRYVVDPDGRTNTFLYSSGFQLTEIDDPYGRKVTLGYDDSGRLNDITDAATNSSSFAYQGDNGWITNLTTPYGNTGFTHYEVRDPDQSVPNLFQQRAIYISEPTGAQQLYLYQHTNSSVSTSDVSPTVPGQIFDDGTSGTQHQALSYRNTFHWGRRQFANLSVYATDAFAAFNAGIFTFSDALQNLNGSDYNKADLKHWMMATDKVSITGSISSERDPSPDVAGLIPGLRTWYNYPAKTIGEPELLGSNPQISSVARILPGGSTNYTAYNFYPAVWAYGGGLVSDNESTYTKPDGSAGVLTNWFNYASGGMDLTSISNSAGQFVNYYYNGSHQITAITNALNQGTVLSWDASTFNLTGIQLPSGKSIGLSYYAPAMPPTGTSSLLQQIITRPEGRSFTVNDYSAGLPSNITDDRGLTVANTWDGLNRLTGTVFPDSSSILNSYYRLDLVGIKDRLGNWTRYAYDGLQHPTTVTNANGAVTSYSWCGCGSLNMIIDALTNTTTLSYDNKGQVTSVVYPDTSSVSYQFDLAGRMTNALDGAGRALKIGYNNQGLATSITGANGQLWQAVYDAINRPINVTDANGITVTNQYDAVNELLKRTWPDNISENFGYNATGLIAYTNRNSQRTLYGRDTGGRLTSVTNANNEITRVGYDSLDNITNLVDGLNNVTFWSYNEYGWLTNKVDGNSHTVFRYTYDPNGRQTTRWTPEKGIAQYGYDAVGNLKSIVYPQYTISYVYDALNRLTNMVDAVGATGFGYTPAGRLQSENGPWASDTLALTYVQGLRTVLNLTQASGSWSQTNAYDAVWHLTNVVSPAGAFGYTLSGMGAASSLIAKISLPNGGNITNGYDALARLTQSALNNSSAVTLDAVGYQYDPLGQRTNVMRYLGAAVSSAAVKYDTIGQLTNWVAREAGGTPRLNEQLGFGYDAAHNLHTRANNALAETFSVDGANELTGVTRSGTLTVAGNTLLSASSVTVNGQAAQVYADLTFADTNNALNNGNNTFTTIAQNGSGLKVTNSLTLNLPASVTLLYDANGNLTNDGLRSFSYDSENELTGTWVAGQWRSTFGYDGLGRRRVSKDYRWDVGTSGWVQTNEVHSVYDGYLLLQERDPNNNVLVTYTRGVDLSGSLSGAGGIGGLLARTDGSGSTFYHADGSGNVTALVNGSQNIVARYLYNPFGLVMGKWGALADANVMQFSSMPHHNLSGMSLYACRAYDPGLQRWLNQDPIGEWGGINLYEAFFNAPTSYVDRSGRDNIWNMGAGNNAPAIFMPPPHNSNAGGSVRPMPAPVIPQLSAADPNPVPYVPPQANYFSYDSLVAGNGVGNVDNPVLNGAAEINAMAINSVLPLPGFKGSIKCPTTVGATVLASKTAARDALKQMGLSDGQLQAALKAVGKATSTSKIAITQDGENVIISTTRPGFNGYQQFQYTIAPNGSKNVVQTAYDQFGNLVHYDPKTQ